MTTGLFYGGSFGPEYNQNRTLFITPPANPDLPGGAGHGSPRLKRVQLSFILRFGVGAS